MCVGLNSAKPYVAEVCRSAECNTRLAVGANYMKCMIRHPQHNMLLSYACLQSVEQTLGRIWVCTAYTTLHAVCQYASVPNQQTCLLSGCIPLSSESLNLMQCWDYARCLAVIGNSKVCRRLGDCQQLWRGELQQVLLLYVLMHSHLSITLP